MNGSPHTMTSGFVIWVLVIGWVSFLLAIVTNCIYYAVHPMAPEMSPKGKLKTHLFGKIVPSEEEDIQAKGDDVELGPVVEKDAEETDPLQNISE